MNSIIQELKTGFRLPRCNSFRTSTFLFLPIVLILLWADSTLATDSRTTMKPPSLWEGRAVTAR